MYLFVTMRKEGHPDQVVRIEVVVHNDVEVSNLRWLGYEIADMELKNDGWY
jgi:hypothetical protein